LFNIIILILSWPQWPPKGLRLSLFNLAISSEQNRWLMKYEWLQTSPDCKTKAAWLWEAETWTTLAKDGNLIRVNATHCVVSAPCPRTPHKLEPQEYTDESLISNVWYLPVVTCICWFKPKIINVNNYSGSISLNTIMKRKTEKKWARFGTNHIGNTTWN